MRRWRPRGLVVVAVTAIVACRGVLGVQPLELVDGSAGSDDGGGVDSSAHVDAADSSTAVESATDSGGGDAPAGDADS